MTVSDMVQGHQARCAPHLARLWMLAGGPSGAPLRPCGVQQIIEATGAILAEVRVAGNSLPPFAGRGGPGTALVPRGAPGSVPGPRRAPGSVPLLTARLNRLENAARQMIDSAQQGDAVMLREQIARFDALTAAIWTVHLSECGRHASVTARR
jgi:hypothetical protein